MERVVSITTIDNPYDQFKDFNNWFLFDIEKGYYTSSMLARLIKRSDDMTEKEETEEIERAVDRMIALDPLDIYIKVTKPT